MGTTRLIDAIGQMVMAYQELEIQIEKIALPTWMIELIDVELATGLDTPNWLGHGFNRHETTGKIVIPDLLFGIPVFESSDDFYLVTALHSNFNMLVKANRERLLAEAFRNIEEKKAKRSKFAIDWEAFSRD